MKTFRITNTTSGHSLGDYAGESPEAAISAMLADAGCAPDDADPDLVATAVEFLTRAMIEELRDEAGDAGDLDMVEICDHALHYEPSHPEWSRRFWMAARGDVATAINEARAANPGAPPERVVA